MAENNLNKITIDAVIPWVDGNDKNHQLKMIPYLDDKSIINSEKFRTRFDHVNEIEFAINSILTFAPFIRTIFIVTDNQIPQFLNNREVSKKISIIDHKIIFAGYEKYLPTFNNRPIETCIHRIPDLAEHFIYFNDDTFLINPTKPDDFFINGLPVLRGKWTKFDEDKIKSIFKAPKKGHKTAQQQAAKKVGFKRYYRFRHTPHPMRKSIFENYFKEHKEIFIENIKYRFRSPNQFTPQGLANHIEIKNKTCFLKKELQLLYFRSYKKPLFWYHYKFNNINTNYLFLGLQSLDRCEPKILQFLLNWLKNKIT